MVRINPGIGAGQHQKVITGGTKTKFGVDLTQLEDIKAVASRYDLHICGLNTHIGSNFLNCETYLQAATILCQVAEGFPELEYLDFGGGLGISYKGGGDRLDVIGMGRALKRICVDFSSRYGKPIRFLIEPGRYPVAESGLLLTTVTDLKRSPHRSFIGTDAGFNVFLRPSLYNAYHEIINCRNLEGVLEPFDVCGNICETGDVLAEGAPMPPTQVSDTLAILDVGAYGYAMASNYNSRPRPAEVLLQANGEFRLIRKRDRLEDLLENQLPA